MIIVVDSSAWIAAYRSPDSAVKRAVAEAISKHTICVPDLVLLEVLRGINAENVAKSVAAEFANFNCISMGGRKTALLAAANYRFLRGKGITVRGTIDCFIATWCIKNTVPLLHADRNFEGFEQHLGLKCWPVQLQV